jgi:hypothetical protein
MEKILAFKAPDPALTTEAHIKDSNKSYNLYQRVQAWMPLQAESTANEEVWDLLRYC